MLRGHPVIQLGALSREHVIMSYLGLVMTAPCHCALLSSPEPFAGRKLVCLAQMGCSSAQPFSEVLRNKSPLAEIVALGDHEAFCPEPSCLGLSGRPHGLSSWVSPIPPRVRGEMKGKIEGTYLFFL